jgi:diphthine-ammonia ligase
VLRPDDPDSLMFHTPNLDLVALQARAWGKACRAVDVRGRGEAGEITALAEALRGADGWVVAGAIESSFQWARLIEVARHVGRPVYTPLWRKDPGRVVREEIGAGLDIRLVHLAAESLGPDLLGKRLDLALLAELERRQRTGRGAHVAGEGGEYETLVVDAPFFSSRIEPDDVERTETPSTSRWSVRAAHLVRKSAAPGPGAAR